MKNRRQTNRPNGQTKRSYATAFATDLFDRVPMLGAAAEIASDIRGAVSGMDLEEVKRIVRPFALMGASIGLGLVTLFASHSASAQELAQADTGDIQQSAPGYLKRSDETVAAKQKGLGLKPLQAPPAVQGLHLQIHGLSKHLHERSNGQEWRESNPGVALRLAWNDTWSAQAGLYKNSIDKDSAYLMGDYTPLHWKSLHFGLSAGLASGYEGGSLRLVGAVLARWQGEKYNLGLRFSKNPAIQGHGVWTLEGGMKL